MNQLIQKAVETLEKMKSQNTKKPDWDSETSREDVYCRAISDIQSLLPQIITGVIEEIEKEVRERVEKESMETWNEEPIKEVVKE
jgi:hypothetical protein